MLIASQIPPVEGTPAPKRKPLVSSGVLGVVIFIVTEVMFFAALVSAHLIIRAGSTEWPPWGQPRLPIYATAFNTLVLLASGIILIRAYKLLRQNELLRSKQLVGVSIVTGTFFVIFQGYEWVQLIRFGLLLTSSTYGALFYLIIGSHGLHAAGALCALIYAYFQIDTQATVATEKTTHIFLAVRTFWLFVVGIWPMLYILIYIV